MVVSSNWVSGEIEWKGCDLGDFKQVKEVFGKLAASEPRLDYVRTRLYPSLSGSRKLIPLDCFFFRPFSGLPISRFSSLPPS